MKRAGRWAMTEAQIEEAIESMCIEARPPDRLRPLDFQSTVGTVVGFVGNAAHNQASCG